jgi:hypothetical protein
MAKLSNLLSSSVRSEAVFLQFRQIRHPSPHGEPASPNSRKSAASWSAMYFVAMENERLKAA